MINERICNSIVILNEFALFVRLLDVLSAPEKRQLVQVNQCYSHLLEMIGKNEVAEPIRQKVAQIAVELQNRNYPAATAIQTVRSDYTHVSIDVLLM